MPAGTEVATRRAPGEQPIIFATTADAVMPAVELLEIRSLDADGTVREHGTNLQATRQVAAFQAAPALGDALLFGLSDAAPSCAVALRLACQVEGLGVDPDAPPLLWEAWDGTNWAPCDVDRDDTGGLNKSGDVVLHLPPTHSTHLVGGLRAGWLRARVIEPPFGRTPYTTTPTLSAATAYVIGATVEAVHAERVPTEPLGESEGVAGQRFSTSRTPVLDAGDGLVLEVGGSDGWVAWERVPDFADSEPADRHFVLDGTTGLVELGPQIRWPDGSVRQYGAIPPHGAPLRLRSYLTGGGAAGNVRAHAIEVLRTSIPYVSRVDNRRPARGGQDAEDLANARLRGAQMLPLERPLRHRRGLRARRPVGRARARARALRPGGGGVDDAGAAKRSRGDHDHELGRRRGGRECGAAAGRAGDVRGRGPGAVRCAAPVG